MANIYKNAKVDFTSTDNTTIYTCPSNARAIIQNIILNDDSGSGDSINITLVSGANTFSLFKAQTVTGNQTLQLLDKPLILQESEILKGQATTADRLHMVVSLLEISRSDQNG
jgi:hypothetical protein